MSKLYEVEIYIYSTFRFEGNETRVIKAYQAADIQPMFDAEARSMVGGRIEVRKIKVYQE